MNLRLQEGDEIRMADVAQLMAVDSEEDDEDDEDDPDFDPLSKEDNSIQTSEMVSSPNRPISASPSSATLCTFECCHKSESD